MTSLCLTLYEGDHVWGVGALANSLYRCGFRGTLVVGWRGALPPWLPAEGRELGRWQPAEGLVLQFLKLPETPGAHQLKPWAMLQVLDRIAPEADRVFLFDADALALARWPYFEALVEEGAAVVLDMGFPRIAMTHPWRRAWAELCREAGYSVRRTEDAYMSAFCGISRRHRPLIEAWWHLTEVLHGRRPEIVGKFKDGDRMIDPFHGTDQDLLDAAVMATEVPLCTLGPESFGFTGSPHTMLHPIGPKPWRGSALARLLRRGRAPDLYSRHFHLYLDAPIEVMSRHRRRRHAFDISMAGALGRIVRG